MEKKIEQELIDEQATSLTNSLKNNTEFEPFALYLRPFDTTNRLLTQVVGMVGGPPSPHIDLETLLYHALEPYYFLCGLGQPGEMEGAGRIKVDNMEWYNVFQLLVECADLIIMIPSDHDGTFKEMQFITQNDLIDKCIFIMPETINKKVDYTSKWQSTIDAASKLRWELPYYDYRGAVFTLNKDGKLAEIVHLSLSARLFRVWRIRKTLKRLIQL